MRIYSIVSVKFFISTKCSDECISLLFGSSGLLKPELWSIRRQNSEFRWIFYPNNTKISTLERNWYHLTLQCIQIHYDPFGAMVLQGTHSTAMIRYSLRNFSESLASGKCRCERVINALFSYIIEVNTTKAIRLEPHRRKL